jgi:cell division protein FtsI/penicillin-binding protein 2
MELKIQGLDISKDNIRYYPSNNLASHVLGFISESKNDGTLSGKYGLEKLYDKTLTRVNNGLYVNFFADTLSNITKSATGNESDLTEGDVVLTIEPSVQSELEKQLAAVKEKYNADLAGGIVMEPTTGRIVAMGALPSYNPNEFGKVENISVFMNPAIESVFEMGSIMKPMTMAAALDAGVVTASTTYNDKGFLVLNGKRIANFDGKGRGVVPMQEVLNQSLNTGAVFAMEQLGFEKFSKKMLDYGFGEKTGVDLPNELAGLVGNLNSKREIEHATASYGQGIAVTPIEMTRALAAMANGGLLMQPQIVGEIDYNMGIQKKFTPVVQRRVLKPETAKEISRMLTIVVDKALVNGKISNPNYSVAAKTGTAFLTDDHGGYYSDKFFHSFFGYFPANSNNARFLVFLYLRNPKNVQYASATLTDPFMNIMNYLVNYYEIPPDRGQVNQTKP